MNKYRINKNPSTSRNVYNETIPFLEKEWVIYTLLGLTVLFVVVARLNILSFPLERDEGEYAYMGKLILDGHTPYSLAYNMKYPGTYYMYALIMAIFGKTITGIHLGLLVVSVISTILVFFVSKNFISKTGAIIAAISFGIMGTSHGLLGQATHATHFVVFFALIGILSLLRSYEKERHKLWRYLFSGIFFSLAFICKQSGVFFVFFGYSIILFKEFSFKPLRFPWKNFLIFTVGFVSPILLMFAVFYGLGIFDTFWFWTFTYLSQYGSKIPISFAFEIFKANIGGVTLNYTSEGYIILWIISLISIPMIFFSRKTIKEKLIILFFLLFSFLTIIPGFHFRNHYFVTLLPAFALLIGLFFDFFNRIFSEKLKRPNLMIINLLIFLVILGHGVNANKDYLFYTDTKVYCKKIYRGNPFVESIKIAKYLKQNSDPDDKIAILGSEPQILFYADRYSATGYLYTYSLMENHPYVSTMQKEMIAEIELNKPKYFIYVAIYISWLGDKDSATTIFEWANEFARKHYKLVGFIPNFLDRVAPLEIGASVSNDHSQGEIIYIFERDSD